MMASLHFNFASLRSNFLSLHFNFASVWKRPLHSSLTWTHLLVSTFQQSSTWTQLLVSTLQQSSTWTQLLVSTFQQSSSWTHLLFSPASHPVHSHLGPRHMRCCFLYMFLDVSSSNHVNQTTSLCSPISPVYFHSHNLPSPSKFLHSFFFFKFLLPSFLVETAQLPM